MRIQLETALGNCKFQHLCACNTKSSFEETNDAIFYVYDEEGGQNQNPSRIVNNEEDYFQLTIHNESKKNICFVKTDKCLVVEEEGLQKCDCLVFDDKQFYFVEIKTCKSGKRAERRKEAIIQLECMINLLVEENKIDLKGFKTTALICFKTIVPRIIQASKKNAKSIFNEKYNIDLAEGNEIVF
jgi:hypothetical protein